MREELTFRRKISNLARGYKLCHTLAPTYIARSCAATLIQSVNSYIGIWLSGVVVEAVTGEQSMEHTLIAALVCVGVNLLLSVFAKFIVTSKETQLRYRFWDSHMMLAMKCMELDYVRIENPETHRRKSVAASFLYKSGSRYNGLGRLFNDTGEIFNALMNIVIGFGMCFNALFLIPPAVSGGFMGFAQSIWAVLALFLCYAGAVALRASTSRKSGGLWQEFFENKENNQYQRVLGFFVDLIKRYQRGKDVRIYDQSEMLQSEWTKFQRKTEGKNREQYRKMRFVDTLEPLISVSLDVLTYAFVITRALGGMYTPSVAVVLVMSITKMLSGVNRLMSVKVDFLDIVPLNLGHVYDFLDIEDEKYKGTIPTEKRDDNEYEFEFRHVYFKYPGSEQYVLSDVNLKWRIGEKMALVGRNGSGKSTLIKLLCRLYDPTEGEITLNGIDIRKYNYDEYMALFSVVFQDSKLFSFSVAENVAADTEYDRERVEDCLRRAGLSKRLDELPDGIETYLYKDFDDNGVEISGGEAQKLCLARAIYKGSPFIVLDEPTAALDPIAEHEIYTNFNSVVGTRTAIYISHRLSSCRFCDDITVLDGGRIVQRGSHESLLKEGGIYSEMWTAQAEYYKDTAGELFS